MYVVENGSSPCCYELGKIQISIWTPWLQINRNKIYLLFSTAASLVTILGTNVCLELPLKSCHPLERFESIWPPWLLTGCSYSARALVYASQNVNFCREKFHLNPKMSILLVRHFSLMPLVFYPSKFLHNMTHRNKKNFFFKFSSFQ